MSIKSGNNNRFAYVSNPERNVGWKARVYTKANPNHSNRYSNNGRRKPKGKAYTKSAVQVRRKARHNAARRHAK